MDTLAKAVAYEDFIRIYAATTTEIVKTAQQRHGLWPSSSAALGRTLTASILTSMLKEENITVKINGGGPIGEIVVEALNNGTVRGYCDDPYQFYQYNEDKGGKINVSYAVGTNGSLSISTIINNEVFTSTSPLQTGEIAEDFTYYFAASEQIPSAVGLGVLVNDDNTVLASGGFIIQVLPGCPENILDLLELRLKEIKDVSTMVKENYSPVGIIKEIAGSNYKILEENIPLKWQCRCTREKFKNAIRLLDNKEIDEMIEEGHIETVCHFCNEKYEFNKEDLLEIKKNKEVK